MEGYMRTVQKGFWGRKSGMRSRIFQSSLISVPISEKSNPYTTFKIWRTTPYFFLKINIYLMEGYIRDVHKGFGGRIFGMRSRIFQSSLISLRLSEKCNHQTTFEIQRTVTYFFVKINTYLMEGHMRTILNGFWGRMFRMLSRIVQSSLTSLPIP